MVTFDVGWETDQGAVRQLNEDRVFVGTQVVAVADGMGGHAAGDVASSLAVAALAELDALPELRPDDIVAATIRASELIAEKAEHDPQSRGMGTTIAGVGLVTVGGCPHWAIFHVGDSRVYHVQAGQLRRATTDHSEVEELVLAGRITPEQARVHPDRNVITRSLGTTPAPQVDIRVTPPAPDERYLVCSDGLVNELEDLEIEALLRQWPTAREAATALLQAALSRGARDNVSVIVLDSAEAPSAAAPSPMATTQPRDRLGKEPA